MNKIVIELYNNMPGGIQNIFATARGVQLRGWRYGPETDELADAALERDTWSAAQWKTYREERLAYILDRAVKHVPYYRDHWAKRRQQGDQAATDLLENWPILEKETLRRENLSFVADNCDPRKLYHLHTSGTTGTPLNIWWPHHMVREHYALQEARARRWYGVSRLTPFAIIGGQLIVRAEKTHPPFWVTNYAMHQLYMSSYHLSPQFIPAYIEALKAHRAQFILAYTSSVYTLAQGIIRSGIEPPKIKCVITNAEPVYDFQRETIRRAFGCPVYETYGQAESAAFGSECTEGNLHLWPEVGWIEIVDGAQPLPLGEVGDIVTTGLLNDAMPLIRYRLGDRASLSSDQPVCKHTLPRFGKIEGRSDDTLYTLDGRRIGRLDPIFKADLPIKEAQIIQQSLDRVMLRYVPDQNFRPEDEQYVAEQLRKRMGNIQVTFEAVEALPRTRNGKFRAVINQMSPEERAKVTADN